MAINFRKFFQGIRIVPKTTSSVSEAGDLDFDSTNNKLNIHNGTTSSPLVSEAHAATITNKTIDADQNTLSNIDNADIKAGAAIDRAKLASGTADHVLINNGSGVLSSEAQLSPTRGGTGVNSTATFPSSGTIATVPGAGVVKSNGTALSSSNIDLTTEVTGVLPTANGGTGVNSTATFPSSGVVVTEAATQTLTNKTIDGTSNTLQNIPSSAVDLASATSIGVATTNSVSTVDIGTGTAANVINIGGATSTVNITGSVNNNNVTNLNVTDKLITINNGGGAGSGGSSGFEIQEAGSPTGYVQSSSDRNSYQFKAPNTAGVATLTPGASSDNVILGAASQVLSNKDIDGGTASNTNRLTTPKNTYSNLSGLTRKEATLLYGTDTQKLYVDNGSSLVQVGSGNGSINYIANPDAETDLTGWGTYNNAPEVTISIASPAVVSMVIPPVSNPFKIGQKISFSTSGALPTGLVADTDYYVSAIVSVSSFRISATPGGADINTSGSQSGTHNARMATPSDGVSAMATKVTTLTRTTSSPLVGNASFLITKDAANRRGEGVSYSFSIDPAYKASMLSISFNYTLDSGSLSEGDYQVFILDVTNSTLIYPTSQSLSFLSGQNYQFQAQFQSASNSTSYRLIVHNTSNNLLASTVKYDNVSVGPKLFIGYTPISTDPENYTPVFTTVTASNISIQKSYQGKFLILEGYFTHTGGAGELTMTLPDGSVIDDSLIGSTNFRVFGVGSLSSANLTLTVLGKGSFNTVSFGFAGGGSGGGDPYAGAWGSETIKFFAQIPIKGKSSESKIISEYDGRVVIASAYGDAASATSGSIIVIPTKEYDSHSAYNSTTGRFTVPVSGYYRVHGFIISTTNGGQIELNKNASPVKILGQTDTNGECAYTGTVQAVAGDLLDIRALGATIDAQTESTIHFELLSGAQQITAGDKYLVSYKATSSTGAGTDISFSDKVIDTHGSFNGSVFTSMSNDIFEVSSSILLGAGAGAGTRLQVFKNGTLFGNLYGYDNYPAGGANIGHSGSVLVSLVIGDTLSLRYAGATGMADFGSTDFGRINIKRISH